MIRVRHRPSLDLQAIPDAVARGLRHPRLGPALALAALLWGAGLAGLLLVGPGLGPWADPLLVACFGFDAATRRYRLDRLLVALFQPPLFVAVVAVAYRAEVRAALRSAAGRAAAAAAVGLFLGLGTLVLATVEVSPAGAPAPPAAVAPPIRDGRPVPDFRLADHRGVPVTATSWRGRPVALTFVYADCHATCPVLLARLRALEARVPDPAVFAALTLEPERDTPAALAAHAARWRLGPRWHLLTGPPAEVRALLDAFGVRRTRRPDGEIAHDNVVILLDRAGRVAFVYRGLAHPEARLEADLQRLAREAG